mgnify:CR=1 FL=1
MQRIVPFLLMTVILGCAQINKIKVSEAQKKAAGRVSFGSLSGVNHRAAAKYMIKFDPQGQTATGFFHDLVGDGKGDINVKFSTQGMEFTAVVVEPKQCAPYTVMGILSLNDLVAGKATIDVSIKSEDFPPVTTKMRIVMANGDTSLPVNLSSLANYDFPEAIDENLSKGLELAGPVRLPGYELYSLKR